MTDLDITIARTKDDLRRKVSAWRNKGLRIGFVPTMGALHSGHLSLVERALTECDRVVASIFVNPEQFAAHEDLDDYPRTEAEDIAKLAQIGCHLAYCPSEKEIYPEGSLTSVRVEQLSDVLDGITRPHFFYGVATVVLRLFVHVRPDVAVFGQKDYQQLQIIKRMVRDIGFDIDIIGSETIRDLDGLAQSSRNVYLSSQERRRANILYRALFRAKIRIEIGANVPSALAEARALLDAGGFDRIDYITATDPFTLEPITGSVAKRGVEGRLLAAGVIGNTRLIDNIGFKR